MPSKDERYGELADALAGKTSSRGPAGSWPRATPDTGIRAPAAPTELLVTPLCQVPEKQGKQECSQLCHWPARSQGHSVQWDVSGQVAC